ncbi:type iv pilin n-term methylation site gfxxxe [Lucifera butyrica]|uniref:Type iv pilin n-term methylation site gfxxxe n=1 Tax=Lucifera butyrica TaxID=1351585 RepID=A0A498R8Z0_9FIRM|nr:prepilin-type N-terminal cleavage/methylation domain-containing protein [Lucifera butyrica]VBB09176.1 type iv pilin n-term methylation site gfxxxe [Lucifera butyrica]
MNLKNSKGFSLIELLVGMALLSIILAGIGEILSSSISAYQYSMEQGTNANNLRDVLAQITHEIRYATSITNPAFVASSKNTANRIDYTIVVNGVTETHTISVGTGTDAHTLLINHNNGTIQRFAINRIPSSASIIFTRDDTSKRKITVSLTLQDQAAQNAPVTTMTTDVVTLLDLP